MKVIHKKLDEGKILRVTTTDMQEHIENKLTNNPVMDAHQSQIDVYRIKTGEVIDRQFLKFEDAKKFGEEIKKEFPELAYKIVQIVK